MTDASPETPDPDLAHLADLISMIPGPDDPYFWRDLPSEERTDYLTRTLVVKLLALRSRSPRPSEIASLAQYLLMFFRSDTPAMYEHIGRQTNLVPYELAGRLWLADLHATCWRIYVRYSAQMGTHSTWADKWPANHEEWLAEQRK